MKIFITGACGFVGSVIAESLLAQNTACEIIGMDNLMRPGSETNRNRLQRLGMRFMHGDIRCASDLESIPKVDWVIDAAANPSVLAGVGGNGSSRQVLEHNLGSLFHVLEFCRQHTAGLTLLSTSRVYSIAALAALPLRMEGDAFELDDTRPLPAGVTRLGISKDFSTAAPISLYGSTKLACEVLALEYGNAFGFPVWVNRCGVLAGAGQFGTPDQGIFAFWVNAHLRRRALRYIGFDGTGKQVRDALSPIDLTRLISMQMDRGAAASGMCTVGGGPQNAMSLAQLNAWCDTRFGAHSPTSDLTPRRYDIPWMVMDNSDVTRDFGWTPQISIHDILTAIADHAEVHPNWLAESGV